MSAGRVQLSLRTPKLKQSFSPHAQGYIFIKNSFPFSFCPNNFSLLFLPPIFVSTFPENKLPKQFSRHLCLSSSLFLQSPLQCQLSSSPFLSLSLSLSLSKMAEKGTAYTTTFYSRFTGLAKLSVRFAELCVAMSLLAWISARIPLAVEIFGDCFHQLSGVFSNNLFVFFLCHVILVSLMAKSGQFSGRNQRSSAASSVFSAEDELYDVMVKSCEEDRITTELDPENDVISGEIVYEDKQVISEATVDSIVVGGGNSLAASDDPDSHLPRVLYRRWRSENFEREPSDDGRSENIRRSESEKYLDIVFSGEEEWNPIVVDELSDEDFNRTVEAFIAKQLKFRLQEDGYDAVSASCGDINNKSFELTKEKPCY